jgi:LysR family hydrogen peroxide-inducible transcriptional activator
MTDSGKNSMNLRDLKYLVAVAEYRHFGRAAEACFVSQPALSMQISKLESSLGVQLFERTNKQVFLTPVGREIAARARRVLQEAEEIRTIAKTHSDPCSGELKLGAFPTLAPYLFPLVVPQISKAMPKLKLFLVEDKTEILLQKLRSGQIDAALLALPIESDGLESVELFTDPFYLAVPPRHQFAEKKTISMDEIAGERLLLLEEGHCLRAQALEVCSMMGASEQQDFRATSLETLRQMVASGLGLTLMPEIALRDNDTIKAVPFKTPAPTRTIGLFWRSSSARIECLSKIVGICRKH